MIQRVNQTIAIANSKKEKEKRKKKKESKVWTRCCRAQWSSRVVCTCAVSAHTTAHDSWDAGSYNRCLNLCSVRWLFRDVRVQISIWFQTFLLFTKPHFQTFSALKGTSFQAFQIISDFFRLFLTDALTPLAFTSLALSFLRLAYVLTWRTCPGMKARTQIPSSPAATGYVPTMRRMPS